MCCSFARFVSAEHKSETYQKGNYLVDADVYITGKYKIVSVVSGWEIDYWIKLLGYDTERKTKSKVEKFEEVE